MNPFEFVLFLVAMVFVFQLIKHKAGIRSGRERGWGRGHGLPDARAADDGETMRLREEVSSLKERIKVLERITVEKENSLSREIEDLRGR